MGATSQRQSRRHPIKDVSNLLPWSQFAKFCLLGKILLCQAWHDHFTMTADYQGNASSRRHQREKGEGVQPDPVRKQENLALWELLARLPQYAFRLTASVNSKEEQKSKHYSSHYSNLIKVSRSARPDNNSWFRACPKLTGLSVNFTTEMAERGRSIPNAITRATALIPSGLTLTKGSSSE